MIVGKALNFNEEELNKFHKFSLDNIDDYDPVLEGSSRLRASLINDDYKITHLFPVYHQGWEIDEWAVRAVKNDVSYFITTNHGMLDIKKESDVKFKKIDTYEIITK